MDWDELDVPPPVYPDNGVGKGLMPLLQNKAFADMKDFTIKVDSHEYKVHKLVLVAASHYFKALLEYADAEDKNLNEAELKGLNPLAVSNLIDYIYTNEITATRASPEDLLEAASYLQIPPAIEMATKFMKDAVNENNCFDYLPIFDLYSLKREVAYTKDFIQMRFDDVIRAHSLNSMSHEKFLQVVELWVNPEWELFEAILRWVSVHEEREQHMDSLLHHVRFVLMTPDELHTTKNLTVYKHAQGTWTSLVDKASDYHSLPVHKKVADQSGQNTIRQQPTPVIFSTRESDDNESHALQKDGSWKRFSTNNSPDLHEGLAASVVLNDFLIVCQAYSRSQDWHIFDPRTLTWASMSKMKEPRKEFAVAHDGRYLYAMGGYLKQAVSVQRNVLRPTETDSMVRYDFDTDTWTDLDTKLPVPWHKQYACHVSGYIYMTGGFSGCSQCLRRLDRFNPGKQTWEPRASMFEKRPCFSMNTITLRGEDYIHVMHDNFRMQYYNPRTDQWSLWTSFSDMRSDLIADINPRINHKDREDTCVLAHGDTLYLLNFDRDCEYRGEDDYVVSRTEAAGCVTWTVRCDSRQVTQRHLNDFPLYDEFIHEYHCFERYTAGLLAFPCALPAEN